MSCHCTEWQGYWRNRKVSPASFSFWERIKLTWVTKLHWGFRRVRPPRSKRRACVKVWPTLSKKMMTRILLSLKTKNKTTLSFYWPFLLYITYRSSKTYQNQERINLNVNFFCLRVILASILVPRNYQCLRDYPPTTLRVVGYALRYFEP